MRSFAGFVVLLAACAAPYRAAYEAADAESRAFAAYREAPEGTALELRARLLRDGRVVLDPEAQPDFSGGVSPEAAVRAAMEANAELRAAVAQCRVAIERIPQAAFPPTPDLQVFGRIGVSDSVDRLRRVMPMLTQMFPAAGALDAQVQAAVAAAYEAFDDVRERENRVRAEVADAIATLYATDRALAINRSNMDVLRTVARAAEAAHRTGRATQQDLLRAQLRMMELELREVELRRTRAAAAARFNELVGRDGPAPVGPVEPGEIALDVPEPEPLLGGLERTRPEVARAARQMDRALWELRLAELAYAPELTAAGGVMWMRPQMGPVEQMVDALIGIPLKFLHRPKYEALEREARAGVGGALESYREVLLRARREVVAAHAALAEAVESVRLLEGRLLPAARQTFEAATAAYENAQVDVDTVLEAQEALQMIEERWERARADVLRAREELRRAVGAREVLP